jgi:hypothetical protein
MKDLKIINNALEEKNSETIKAIMTQSPEFAWFFNDGVSKVYDGHIQFLHHFYRNYGVNSDWMSMLDPIIKLLNPLSLVRIKANLLVRTPKIIEHGMHIDQAVKDNKKLKTAIYYVNTNNGYTRFKKDKKKIISKQNKLVIFNNDLEHTGTTCTDERIRVVINFNYVER